MKFQDCSLNGLKVTVGTKSVTHAPTHARTHAPKAICPIKFFKVGGINSYGHVRLVGLLPDIEMNDTSSAAILSTAPSNS